MRFGIRMVVGGCWALGASLALAPVEAVAQLPAQIVAATPSAASVPGCTTLRVLVRYDTSPSSLSTTGVPISLHWSSGDLTFVRVEDVFLPGLVGVQLLPDDDDDDEDTATDQRLVTGWINSGWPDQLPIDLYTIVFDTARDFDGTTLRFSVIEASPGFTFDAPPLELPAAMQGLDLDGNGTIEALADGVLAVRFMFGLRGSALTAGAIGQECSRCTADQVECYLGAVEEAL